jgi:hypothetical protein
MIVSSLLSYINRLETVKRLQLQFNDINRSRKYFLELLEKIEKGKYFFNLEELNLSNNQNLGELFVPLIRCFGAGDNNNIKKLILSRVEIS